MTFVSTAIAVAINTPGAFEAPHPLRTTSCFGAAVIEERTGKYLWGRDPNTPRYPASTTKIMTTLLMLEKCAPEDVITAPSDVTKVRESSMNLRPGEGVRVKNMAYALMLRSANDGCYATAVHVAGSVGAFADMMNARAREIGCQNTHFSNPNGLHNSDHSTTPFDLCLIGREAMKREDFREVVKTKKFVIERSMNFADRMMENHNKILWLDSTADGVKTGWTIPAGHTYVGSATRDGMRIIDSLMYAEKWKDDQKRIMDWAFSEYELKTEMEKGPVPASLLTGAGLECEAELRETAYACVHKSGDMVETTVEVADGARPYRTGDRVGNLVIKDKDGFVQKKPIYATSNEPVKAVVKSTYPTFPLAAGIGGVGVVGLGFAAVRLRLKKSNRAAA